MRRLLLLAVTACIAGLLLTSCDDPFSFVDGLDSTTEELIGPTWQLIALQSSEGDWKALNAEEIYTLSFGADGRLDGRADCNSYFGSFDARDGGNLSVDSLGTTEVYCGEDSRYDTYMRGIRAAQAYEVRDDHLLIGYKQKGVLTYKRIERKKDEQQETHNAMLQAAHGRRRTSLRYSSDGLQAHYARLTQTRLILAKEGDKRRRKKWAYSLKWPF